MEKVVSKPKAPLPERILDAETFASKALADANHQAELGNHVKADKLYATAQFWHDRWVLLTERGDRTPPKR